MPTSRTENLQCALVAAALLIGGTLRVASGPLTDLFASSAAWLSATALTSTATTAWLSTFGSRTLDQLAANPWIRVPVVLALNASASPAELRSLPGITDSGPDSLAATPPDAQPVLACVQPIHAQTLPSESTTPSDSPEISISGTATLVAVSLALPARAASHADDTTVIPSPQLFAAATTSGRFTMHACPSLPPASDLPAPSRRGRVMKVMVSEPSITLIPPRPASSRRGAASKPPTHLFNTHPLPRIRPSSHAESLLPGNPAHLRGNSPAEHTRDVEHLSA